MSNVQRREEVTMTSYWLTHAELMAKYFNEETKEIAEAIMDGAETRDDPNHPGVKQYLINTVAHGIEEVVTENETMLHDETEATVANNN